MGIEIIWERYFSIFEMESESEQESQLVSEAINQRKIVYIICAEGKFSIVTK